jgi:hypothetical protein
MEMARNPKGLCHFLLGEETDTTPMELLTFLDTFPRVATKRGNPGLCAVTASRYCCLESRLLSKPPEAANIPKFSAMLVDPRERVRL